MRKELESLRAWKKYLKRDKTKEMEAWMKRRGIARMQSGDIADSSSKEGELAT